MTITTSTSGNEHKITIQGRFDFLGQSEFRTAYEKVPSSSHFIIDFSKADYMDSSALGMLLLLRDYAGEDKANILLTGCCSEIKNILEISNFHQLFTIS